MLRCFVEMADADIRAAVIKDSSERLCKELLIYFPSVLNEKTVSKYTRDDLVSEVVRCRTYLKSVRKGDKSLEGELVPMLKGERGDIEELGATAADVKPEIQLPEGNDALSNLVMLLARQQQQQQLQHEHSQAQFAHLLKQSEDKFNALLLELRPGEAGAEREETRPSLSMEVRVKRASDVLKNTVGMMPEDGLEIPVFFYHLERQFRLNSISDDLYLPLLNQLLNPKARRLIARLDDEDTYEYGALKEAILREFQLTPGRYREHFQTSTKLPGETFCQFTTRLEIALRQYFLSREIDIKDSDVGKQIFELLIADRLKDSLSRDLREMIRVRELEEWLKPNQICQLLDEYVSDKMLSRNRSTIDVHSRGQFQGQGQHSWRSFGERREVRSSNRVATTTRPRIRCYNCGGDHLRRHCTQSSSQVRDTRVNRVAASTQVQDFLSAEELNFDLLESCVNVYSVSDCVDNKISGVNAVSKNNVEICIMGGSCITVPGIIDSGADITVMPREFILSNLNGVFESLGEIKLQGAFGKPVMAELLSIPCKLVGSKFSEVNITCAVTDELRDKRVLLSLDDYKVLNESIVDSIILSESSIPLCDFDFKVCNIVSGEQSNDRDPDPSNVGGKVLLEGVLSNCESDSKFLQMQKADESLNSCFERAKSGDSQYILGEGDRLLFKVGGQKKKSKLLVLPTNKRSDVLRCAHDQMGHFAFKKVYQLVTQNFWWPKIKQDIKSYCDSCIECARKRKLTVWDRVPIKPVDKPSTSFQVVAIDIFGPIEPPSSRGYKYVLGIVCLQSRWVECYPLKTLQSREICENILKFVSYAGIPSVLISDNAASMVSKLNQELYKLLGIELRNSTPFHSEGNALIERFWGTFRSMLTHTINSGNPRNWDLMIPSLLFAYRNVVNSVTGLTPYKLVFGHDGRNILDVLYDVWSGSDLMLPVLSKSDQDFFKRVRENLDIAQKVASENSEKCQQEYIKRYNLRARDKSFNVGEQVLVLMPDSSNRLKARWIGPGIVADKLSEYSYLVSLDNGAVRQLHANKLRKFIPRVQSIGVINGVDEEFGDVCELPLSSDSSEFEKSLDELDLNHLSAEPRLRLIDLLRKHERVFSNIPGKCSPDIATHKIRLEEGFQPKIQKPYRIPEKVRKEVDKQIDDLIRNGRIRESNSPYGHPIVCVTKPSGDIRMCIDFRYVNQGTISDKYPMKRVDELLYSMCGADFLTSLDCTQGYYQIPMDKDSIKLTAFVTHRGQFENLYMPFGLKCASQTFQRALDRILAPVYDCAKAYIDDVCCHTVGELDVHLNALDKVLQTLSDAGLTLKLSKCKFAMPKLQYVGHVIGSGTLQPNPSKVEALKNLSPPDTKKKVRSILAMFRYYHSFIPNFSDIIVPLVELTKHRQSSSFQLNEPQLNAFVKLKESLINAVALHCPVYGKPFIVHTDASDYAISGCLSQLNDYGVEVPIMFVSKKLSDVQRKWSVIEKEAFAIVYSLKQFDYFIFGYPVLLYTDHNPLTYMLNSIPKSAKLTRWSLSLQRWDITLKYKDTKSNVVADCLSRV